MCTPVRPASASNIIACATAFTGVVVIGNIDSHFSLPLALSPLARAPGLKMDTVGKPCAFTASSACKKVGDHMHGI